MAAPTPTAAGVENKLRLLQSYLDSNTANRVRDSENLQAKELLERAVELSRNARQALDERQLEVGSRQSTEGLLAFSAAAAVFKRTKSGDGAQEKRNVELLKEIDSYQEAFTSGLKEKGPAAAGLLDSGRLEDLLSRAGTLRQGGRHAEAGELLREAQQLTVIAVTRLRQNETIVYSLDFRTPADEYRYELDRHAGYVLLVEQMSVRETITPQALKLAARYTVKAAELKAAAERSADNGDFEAAIKVMEEANKSLTRALQMMGLAIPG
ncbi:MAG: hypothetical protein DRQ37_05915 [Gammaproteobacteria bacterium]|nr:MAG: hypothetical protein DRQ37_05915 [Gammaproteobacteria bacterium]